MIMEVVSLISFFIAVTSSLPLRFFFVVYIRYDIKYVILVCILNMLI